MKIAMVAPVIANISNQNHYGGIERIILSLLQGLTDNGHDIVLYAPENTDINYPHLKIRKLVKENKTSRELELELFQRLIQDQDEFDLIHTHIEPYIAQFDQTNYYTKINKPLIVTMHNQTYIDNHIQFYQDQQQLHHCYYVFISYNQAKPLSFLPNKTVIYNGIALDKLSFSSTPKSKQLAFLGRIAPEKGIVEAIQIAKATGKKLLIAAAIDKTQQTFYQQQVKPHIDQQNICFLGTVDDVGKNKLLSESEALLFPIQWEEPFGLVMVESLACGTPVIATAKGSTPEIIQNNYNGFLVLPNATINDYVQCLTQLNNISRQSCHTSVVNRFSAVTMVQQYQQYYQQVLKQWHTK